MSTSNFTLNVAPEMLSALFVGAIVDVSVFPMHQDVPGIETVMQDPPGKYFVDSVVLHADRHVEIGIAELYNRENVDYYDLADLQMRVVSPGIFNFGPVR